MVEDMEIPVLATLKVDIDLADTTCTFVYCCSFFQNIIVKEKTWILWYAWYFKSF